MANVSWKSICKPQCQGGLGLKDLYSWNKALLVKHIWNIASKKETLRVKWVNTVKLKNTSIWVVQKDASNSRGWKNLLDIRDLIIGHMRYVIGNRRDTFMWFDNWSGLGLLINNLTFRDLYNARLDSNSCVADMIQNGEWQWSNDWVVDFPFLTHINAPNIHPSNRDKINWIDSNGRSVKFCVKNVYDVLRSDDGIVNWGPLIWFSQGIQKHCFILWMAIQDKLLTHDRMKRWGTYDMMVCSLCKCNKESHNHLFFQCPYSQKIWSAIQTMMDVQIHDTEWHSIVDNLSRMPCNNNIWSIIRRLSFGALEPSGMRKEIGKLFAE